MTIHELFERYHSDQTGNDVQDIEDLRMSNGSYGNAHVSVCFRNFKAGFEANQGEKMQVLGYLSQKEVQLAADGEETYLCKIPMPGARIAVYVKQCDTHKTGEES